MANEFLCNVSTVIWASDKPMTQSLADINQNSVHENVVQGSE